MSPKRFRIRASLAALALMSTAGLVVSGRIGPAQAAPSTTSVNCPRDSLASAITVASPGDTLLVSGRCTGSFVVSKRLTLKGTLGATLDGGGIGRTLTIQSPKPVVVEALTVTGGSSVSNERGGGIYNSGKLVLRNMTVSGNGTEEYTTTLGGGIYNSGTLTLFSSTVSDNSATSDESSDGGGIYNVGTLSIWGSVVNGNSSYGAAGILNSGTLNVSGSSVNHNDASDGGTGGIGNSGTLSLAQSTLSDNGGGAGALLSSGIAILDNSTVSDNRGVFGGAITNQGRLTVRRSTVNGNSGGYGPGGIVSSDGTVVLESSLVAGNAAEVAQDCQGAIHSNGYNIIGDADGCDFIRAAGDQVGSGSSSGAIDPLLGPLTNNGGRTQTHALNAGSPALNAIPVGMIGADGVTVLCPVSGTKDQRSVWRPQGVACDIGAFERRPLVD